MIIGTPQTCFWHISLFQEISRLDKDVEEKAKEPCTCTCEILKENLIDANKEIAELKKKLQETQELMAYYVLHRTPRPDT